MHPTVPLALLASLAVCFSPGCRRKTPQVVGVEAVAVEQTADGAERAKAPAVAGGAASEDRAAVRVRATMNGGPIPEGVACDVKVFDEGSSISSRGSGACGDTIAFEPGKVDVELRLHTDGGL